MTHPVAPELFAIFRAYCEDFDDGGVAMTEPVTAGSRIVAFLDAFFEQFFRVGLGLRDSRPMSWARATALRRAGKLTAEQEALVKSYEDYCSWEPDIYGTEYQGYAYLYEEFHGEYLRYFVDDVVRWAKTTGDKELIEAATEAQTAYLMVG